MNQSSISQPQVDEGQAFRAMFTARKDVFIDLLRWELPVLDGKFEIDEFDTPEAEYLILCEKGGQHRASTRLLQTDGPHLLANIYSHLCVGPVPTGHDIREITRFCLDRNQTSRDRLSARNQLVTGLTTYALRWGISQYTGVADLAWFKKIQTFGWDCRALGTPIAENGRLLVALQIHIDETTPERLHKTGAYQLPDDTMVMFGVEPKIQ